MLISADPHTNQTVFHLRQDAVTSTLSQLHGGCLRSAEYLGEQQLSDSSGEFTLEASAHSRLHWNAAKSLLI